MKPASRSAKALTCCDPEHHAAPENRFTTLGITSPRDAQSRWSGIRGASRGCCGTGESETASRRGCGAVGAPSGCPPTARPLARLRQQHGAPAFGPEAASDIREGKKARNPRRPGAPAAAPAESAFCRARSPSSPLSQRLYTGLWLAWLTPASWSAKA